ncbi:MAG: hypothetical protein F4X66_14445 [Chloroflexi bacterium]|nr:hypothetical protein [Chloroflexota bacterium]MYE40792.1 hypothetical protein [Chloroflexota bacterium]
MTWDPPDLWATIILSIPGGIVAGVLVLLGEVALRRGHERVQRGKAEKAIGRFFAEWESTINDTEEIPYHPSNPTGGPIDRAVVQFAYHGDFLRRAPNLIARWSRYLTAEQVEELSNLLEGHQGAVIGILPQGRVLPTEQYARFFSEAREIGWLKF